MPHAKLDHILGKWEWVVEDIPEVVYFIATSRIQLMFIHDGLYSIATRGIQTVCILVFSTNGRHLRLTGTHIADNQPQK